MGESRTNYPRITSIMGTRLPSVNLPKQFLATISTETDTNFPLPIKQAVSETLLR